jgi:hypothetical protein
MPMPNTAHRSGQPVSTLLPLFLFLVAIHHRAAYSLSEKKHCQLVYIFDSSSHVLTAQLP